MATRQVNAEIRRTRDDAELRAVQRFKYDVYVDEMGRYGDIADHANRLLIEPDDATGHVFVVRVDGDLAGTMRLTWGGDGAIGERQIAQYDLAPFLRSVPPGEIVVGERFMIAPAYRGTDVLLQMFAAYYRFVNDRRIQLLFGDCEPHLLNTYQALGFRTYTARNVNSPATGYLIPLVIVAEDIDHLRRISSPLAAIARDFGEDATVPGDIDALLAGGAAVQSEQMLETGAFIAEVRRAAAEANALESGLFRGMTEAEIAVCVEKSVIIACRPGDRLIKQGNPAKNMSMVLSGRLEVRHDGAAIAGIGPGEVFGEIAFFLKLPRTRDVVACAEGARIISFNDRRIRRLIEDDAVIAAKLLLNVSTMLCSRLNRMNQRL